MEMFGEEKEVDLNRIPSNVRQLAEECQFRIAGWDDESDDAIIVGTDVNYIGSKAECTAYMTAWQQCIQYKLREEQSKQEVAGGKVIRGIVSMCMRDGEPLRPGSTATIVARPQVRAFRGDRIAIPDRVAKQFSLEGVQVGNRSMFVQSGEIPCEAFACRIDSGSIATIEMGGRPTTVTIVESAIKEFGRVFHFDVCQTAQDLVFVVRNTGSEPMSFKGFIMGKYA